MMEMFCTSPECLCDVCFYKEFLYDVSHETLLFHITSETPKELEETQAVTDECLFANVFGFWFLHFAASPPGLV